MGLAGLAWVNSEVLQYIREELADSTIFSNYIQAVYMYTDHENYHRLTRRVGRARRAIENAADGAYVTWFYDISGHDYNILELPGLEQIAELKDGIIFKVNRAYDTAAAHQSAYQSIVTGEPVIHSNFDVCLAKNSLTYVREQCSQDDLEAMFFLHLNPVDVNDLPEHRKQYSFDNLNFTLAAAA